MGEAKDSAARRQFLSDEALSQVDEDRLGHRVYVEALRQIIKSCGTPFTIGLLGKWGTGKTSIGRILRTQLAQDEELHGRFRTMEFDVWRYTGDSLRRRFLLDLAECLVPQDVERWRARIRKALYESESKTHESRWRFNVRKVWWLFPLLLGYLALTGLFVYWAAVHAPAAADAVGVAAISVTLILAVLAALDRLAEIGHSSEVTSLTLPPLHSPEQFEDEFNALLHAGGVTGDPAGRKLVVIVDNVDRCDSESAVEALKTVKTFFDKPGCIFVIPCDDQALRAHLQSTYGWEPDSEDASEYLRKFFNTTVRIRPPVEDLSNLANELSAQAGLSEDVARVLWAAEPRDPRRIKQFLNRLLTASTIAQLEEQSNRLPSAVKENLPFLAKMMVLEEKWPGFVDRLGSDDTLLSRVGEALMDPDLLGLDTHADLREYFSAQPGSNYERLEEFLRATSGVVAKDHRPFVRLRQYSYEVAIDETARLREDIRLGAFSRLGSAIAEADPAQVAAIWRTICRVIDEERQARRGQTAVAGANAGTELFHTCPEELKHQAATSITTAACWVSSCLPDVLPRKLLSMLEHAQPVWAHSVVHRMVASLKDIGPYSQDLLSSLPAHHTLFQESDLRQIGLFLSGHLRDNHEAVLQVLRGLELHDSGIQRLLSSAPEALSAVIGGLDAARVEQASNVADVYLPLKGIAPEAVRGEFVGKIGGLLHYPTDPPMGPQKELALSILGQLELADIPSANTDALGASLLAAIAEVGHIPNKIRLWAQALRLRGQLSEGQKQAMDSALVQAVVGWPREDVGALTQLQQLRAGQEASTIALGALASRVLDVNRPWEEKAGLLESYADTLPAEGDWELHELLGSMLDSADVQLVALTAEAVPKYFDRLRRDVQLRLLERLRERTRSLGLQHRHLTLTPLTSLTRMSDRVGLRNGIGDELLSVMKDGDVTSVQNATRLYSAYRPKLSKDRRATNTRELIHSLDDRRAHLGEPFRSLLELVCEETNQVRVRQPALVQFVDLLLSMTHADRPLDQRLLGITSLGKLESLPPQARPEVREQLETIASGVAPGDPVSDAAAGLYGRFFDADTRAPSEARSGREDAPGEEGAEPAAPAAIAISSGTAGEFSEGREGPWSAPVPCNPIHDSWGSLEGARWVWLRERPTDADAKTGQTVWHRLTLDIPVAAARLHTGTLELMVDNVVDLHVNGNLVGTYQGFQSVSHVDIMPHLRLGENLIEMRVENLPGNAESTGESNPAGIVYRLDVTWGEVEKMIAAAGDGEASTAERP